MGRLTLSEQGESLKRSRYGRGISVFLLAILLFLYGQSLLLPRVVSEPRPAARRLLQYELDLFDTQLQRCRELQQPPVEYSLPTSADRVNPRWTEKSGQNQTIILQNATLFDGERFLDHAVDIIFSKGVISHVLPAESQSSIDGAATTFELNGKFVTPGLIDMHSHHLLLSHPGVGANEDINEIHPDTGPLTPFVRALDGLKAYDQHATFIASGGVTSSLILPGSANVMSGEAVMVKNLLLSGDDKEQVVEELLLEHGIPKELRRRYMKMACGENPKRVYGHTRMGDAYVFREQMAKAEQLRQKQDAWCLTAAATHENGDSYAIAALLKDGGLPESLTLDSSVGMLRGQVGVNVHCYEPEDMEDMILHSKEFGFRIQAFHHAIEAWRVPEMIKASGENITIATFSNFAYFKHEAYDASLYAGKILAEHGVPVAYKSDTVMEMLNAKFLLSQAAEGYSFGLPEDKALQSVTSVPAKSVGMEHRIGFTRPGYDADLVVWDSHPLSNGATPLQVYIDGRPTLDDEKVLELVPSMPSNDARSGRSLPQMRPKPADSSKNEFCHQAESPDGKTVISGIRKALLPVSGLDAESTDNLTMVLDGGRVTCIGTSHHCLIPAADAHSIRLTNGHLLPGLTAVTVDLGLAEISMELSTGDGRVTPSSKEATGEDIVYAKYGIHLDGKNFRRARIGGVTRAVTAPVINGEGGKNVFLRGVSAAFKTSGLESVIDGGIVKDDVAVHFVIGQEGKSLVTPTVSSGIGLLRKIITDNKDRDTVYGRAANGSLPIIVHVRNHYDILQLVKIKRDHPSIDLILFGAAEASLVAEELAAADIPLIYTGIRPNPDTFEVKDVLVGPPLTVSPIKVLVDAGVRFGLAKHGFTDSSIHTLALDAGFAQKFAGLSEQEAINLVSKNVEEILHLDTKVGGSTVEERDFVIYEGNPLEWGASVVLAVDGGDRRIVGCWPEAD